MCIYHYCYFSACRHGQLTRISYCDKIPTPGPPAFDRHSYDEADAYSSSIDHHTVSSLHQSTPKINQSISQRMNTQQQHISQHNNIMSTATPSGTGHPPALFAMIQNQNEGTDNQAISTSTAAPIDEERARRENMLRQARLLLDSQGLSDININIALDTQSSLHIGTAHDVASNDPPSASGYSVDSNFSCATGSSWEHLYEHVEHESAQDPDEQSHSPRKPIPTHWLPRATSPKLATAQRAKERVQKKGSEGGSPEYPKIVRAMHSSTDLGRIHSRAGVTYLTKEALVAVEPTRTPPISPKSPVKISSSSKPAWNSPVAPLRSVTHKQSGASLNLSPTKSSQFATNSVKSGRPRGSSSITAASSKSSHDNADTSPVRSPTSSEQSFWSAVEDLEGFGLHLRDSNADSDHEQIPRNANTSSASHRKATSESQATLARAKVALHISIPSTDIDHVQGSGKIPSKSADASEGNDSMILGSLKNTSNIPRVGAMTKGPTSSNIPALQRAKPIYENGNTRPKSTLSRNSDADFESRKGEKTSNILSQTQQEKHAHFHVRAGPEDFAYIEASRYNKEDCDSEIKSTGPYECSVSLSKALKESESFRRTPNSITGRRPRDVTDPVLMDSAIIYSRRKTDDHVSDTGSTHLAIAPDSASPATSKHAGVGEHTEPIQAIGEAHPPGPYDQNTQEKPKQPSGGSDLRATATEFVPNITPASGSIAPAPEPVTLASLQDVPGLPDLTILDRHGIPFLWYMYGIQFAYEQGVRNGQPKSPRKFRSKKPRGSGSWAGEPLPARSQDNFAISTVPRTPHPMSLRQQQSHAELMSLHDGDAQGLHPINDQEDVQPSSHDAMLPRNTENNPENQPFASQLDKIAGYTKMSRNKSNSLPRHYNIDFAKIQNTGFSMDPRNTQPSGHHSVPRQLYRKYRRPGNGLYGGRGNPAGIPISATAPFPNPVPPQGRLDQSRSHARIMADHSGFSIGSEACGMVDITCATELIGGGVCNACDPNH